MKCGADLFSVIRGKIVLMGSLFSWSFFQMHVYSLFLFSGHSNFPLIFLGDDLFVVLFKVKPYFYCSCNLLLMYHVIC